MKTREKKTNVRVREVEISRRDVLGGGKKKDNKNKEIQGRVISKE